MNSAKIICRVLIKKTHIALYGCNWAIENKLFEFILSVFFEANHLTSKLISILVDKIEFWNVIEFILLRNVNYQKLSLNCWE